MKGVGVMNSRSHKWNGKGRREPTMVSSMTRGMRRKRGVRGASRVSSLVAHWSHRLLVPPVPDAWFPAPSPIPLLIGLVAEHREALTLAATWGWRASEGRREEAWAVVHKEGGW